jgi:hypothetical protein
MDQQSARCCVALAATPLSYPAWRLSVGQAIVNEGRATARPAVRPPPGASREGRRSRGRVVDGIASSLSDGRR